MIRSSSFLPAALTAFLAFGAPASAVTQRAVGLDRIVAVVNKDIVTLSEVAEQRAEAERQLRKQGTPLPAREVLERQVLERLILLKAQIQLARESGIRVDEIQLDRAVQRIAENNRMSLPAFRQMLASDGVDFERFRQEVREQILLTRLREREVDEKVLVGESEISLFMEQNSDGLGERVEYNVSHILLRVPEQASPEQIARVQQKADKILADVRAGVEFATLAASYSDAPDALQGGALGWRERERLPDLFAQALASMKPGDTSLALRSAAGFHLLKLAGRRAASEARKPVRQTHVRHILVRTNEVVSEADAKRRLADLRERVVTGGADFAVLARQFSEDGSAARGGDMDWVYEHDTVPEFERAMDLLKPGEISQ
ncbi:MAG: peptidylprolyl isomerase, partial [Betaproteobacteria bacterium]|nr:peptidylprolyl isomerase [Betaproteobacteria bacterium]